MTAVEPVVARWADRIRPHLARTVEGIIAAGRDLVEAKAALPHGQFGPLLAELGMSRQHAARFMAVAQHPILANVSPGRHLPPSVTVLDELTRVPADELADALKRGDIGPSTTRREAAALARTHAAPDPGKDEDGEETSVLAGIRPAPTAPEMHDITTTLRSTCRGCGRWANNDFGDGLNLCARCVGEAVRSVHGSGDDDPGMPVHPALALFPPMTDDERARLTASIAEFGLIEPIVVQNGVLLDGRERLRACRKAGVTPVFREYEGDDLVSVVLSLNLWRQSLTEGQIAFAEMGAEDLRGDVLDESEARGVTEQLRSAIDDEVTA